MSKFVKFTHFALAVSIIPFSQVTAFASEPVETRNPETNYSSSFIDQTRAVGVITETAYDVTVVTEDLQSPWGLDELPDGRLILTQKNGNMMIVNPADSSVTQSIEGFPEVNAGGQGGMLDVAVSPDFQTSRQIFFTYSEQLSDGTVTSVGRGQLSEDELTIEDVEVIFQALPAYNGTNHYGGRIIFDAEGNLYVTTGERSDSGIREEAQSLDSYLGKVIHITTDGNPVNSETDAIYTYGHRNVQGLAIHPITGDIWISEMGPRGGDELNLLESGNNYGWPLVSYGIEYSGLPINEGMTTGDGFTEPVYYWDPVIAPSGMDFYDSSVIAEWENNLFIGGLAGNHIARLVIEGNRVIGEERLLEDEGQRFRDILVASDGTIYAITDDGLLYQIKIAE